VRRALVCSWSQLLVAWCGRSRGCGAGLLCRVCSLCDVNMDEAGADAVAAALAHVPKLRTLECVRRVAGSGGPLRGIR
jgi:hypothetical protein